jgi:hypothetical protein
MYATALMLASGSSLAQAMTSNVVPPTQLLQGVQVGKTTFPPGDTARGGNGQVIDGIEGASQEMLKTHTHSHLSLFYKGVQIAIPYGIGIIKPFRINHGFVEGGKGYYWLHTHDASGIIHVESPDSRVYTLGNFFDVWGQALDSHGAAGLKGAVRVFVNGKLTFAPVREVPLGAHDQITLEVGMPTAPSPSYLFPEGV